MPERIFFWTISLECSVIIVVVQLIPSLYDSSGYDMVGLLCPIYFHFFLIFSDISRVGEYLYKRAIHLVVVQYLHPKIEFADL